MGKFVYELVRGDQHLYLAEGEKVQQGDLPLWMSGKSKVKLDPKARNAFRVNGFKEAKAFLDSMMGLSPKAFRKMAGVDKDWVRPIIINMRRDSETQGLADCVAAQRMYTFVEQE